MNRRTILSLSAITTLGFVLPPSNAVGQQKSVKDQLVGTWTLGSIYIEAPDGSRLEPFGSNPKGILVIDGNGHIAVQFIGSDTAKFASNDRLEGTPEENKAVVQRTLCYFGTYSVNDVDRTLNIHIEGSSYPNWSGTDQKRFLALTGDELKWTTPTTTTGGAGFTGHTVWKRAK